MRHLFFQCQYRLLLLAALSAVVASAVVASAVAASVMASDSSHLEPWQQAKATEVWQPVPNIISAPELAAPSDAQVLLGDKGLSLWQAATGGEAKWQLADGVLTVAPGTGDIKTREAFCDVQLHLEWRSPSDIHDSSGKRLEGQGRGNSGVFLQERYEVQVLDSFNNATYPNGQAASVYKQHIPLVNASRAPGQWQSYDIIFTAPRFDAANNLLTPARVTVLHNGVLVQNHVALQGPTAWIGHPPYEAHGCAPLLLQDHGNPVSFRNIWVRKLSAD